MRNLYTENEVVMCAYIAIFGREDFNEAEVVKIKQRSLSSIKMKVQNIAAMLDEAGIETSEQVTKLTGLPTGETGRKTNWDVVKQYMELPKAEYRKKCIDILSE